MFSTVPPSPAEVRAGLLTVALTALFFALAGWGSLQLSSYLSSAIAAVWLAAGVGAFAALRFGMAGLAGVLVGAFLVYAPVLPLGTAARLALGAVLGAAIVGYLPRYLQPFSTSLDYVPSVAKFALIAAPLGSAVSALVGVFSLHLAGVLPTEAVLESLWIWWLSNLLGVYLIAPLLLTASRWDLLPTHQGARLEGLVLVLGMLLLTLAMMRYMHPLRPAEIVLFVLFPGVLWAALRFSVTGASLAIFLSALIVMAVAGISFGGLPTVPHDIFALQISMIAMALGGACSSRRR